MKRSSIYSLLMLLLVSGGCNNTYTVRTTVYEDGSFEKIVVCEGDSSGFMKLPLPFVFKDGWRLDVKKDSVRSTQFITRATKRFANDDELQAELGRGSDSTKLAVSMHIEKHFRWFYTYYTYEEKIPAFSRFRQSLRFDSVFTPMEIERLRSGKDTLLNKRVDQFWTRNIVEEFIDELTAAAERTNDPALSISRWKEKRSELAERLIASEASNSETITQLIGRTFDAHMTGPFTRAVDSLYQNLLAKVKAEGDLDVSYKNEVVMPGMLLASNAENVTDGVLAWQCRPHRFLDVAMTAESRVLNLWAVVATAVVCVVLLAALVLPMVRLRRPMA